MAIEMEHKEKKIKLAYWDSVANSVAAMATQNRDENNRQRLVTFTEVRVEIQPRWGEGNK